MKANDSMKKLKWLAKCGVILLFLGVFTIIGLYVIAYFSPKLIIKNANSVYLYDQTETLFVQSNGTKDWASLKDISHYLIDATIATEDKNFYYHKGFDYLRILKAVYTNITSGSKRLGASTITQQYARNLFLTLDKTWERKINEAWITFKIETHYTKDEILEGYLNTINYGHGVYGIENASQFYFRKKASDLTLAEASMLAGIPNAPSAYTPIGHEDAAKKRQQIVLSMMVRNGYITEEEKEEAFNQELTYYGRDDDPKTTASRYYQDAVMRELNELKQIPKTLLETGGLKIYTSLDLDAQIALNDSIAKNLKDSEELQVSAIMMDPNNGRIIALTGGRDFATSQFNRAYQSKRQVGSAMKPFLYYAALENGFTASSAFTSEETTFTFSSTETYSPQNWNKIYANKPISMAAAIAYSDNIYAIKTHLFLGEDVLINMAKRVGIKEKLPAIASLPIGTIEMNIRDLVGGYAAFANEGHKITPHLILRVEDMNGNVLYQAAEEQESVLNKSLVYITNELLTSTYDYNFIDYASPSCLSIAPKLSRKYAVKSGSTDTDSVMIGYNKDVIVGVWAGYDDNQILTAKELSYTKHVWADAIETYLKGKDSPWYEMPDNVSGVLVNPITGQVATEKDEKKKILYYLKGTEPYSVKVDLDTMMKEELGNGNISSQ